MNTTKEKRLTWYKLFPSDLLDVLTMDNEEAGRNFKAFVKRLISNKAPEGSIEAKMIAESRAYCDKQRERVMNRWNRNNGEALHREAMDVSANFSSAYAGRNGLVRLTDDDYAVILQAVGNKREADRLIDSLDNSIAEGKIYRSRHLNVLLYWNDYRQDKARKDAELKKVEAEARAEANARHGYKTAAEKDREEIQKIADFCESVRNSKTINRKEP